MNSQVFELICLLPDGMKRRLTPCDKVYLFYMTCRANTDAEAWPSAQRAATDLAISERQIRKSRAKLFGLYLIERSANGTSGRQSTRVRLTPALAIIRWESPMYGQSGSDVPPQDTERTLGDPPERTGSAGDDDQTGRKP